MEQHAQKTQTLRIIIYSLAGTLFFVYAIFYIIQHNFKQTHTDIISYKLQNKNVQVTHNTVTTSYSDTFFTELAMECGTTHLTPDYADKLAQYFTNVQTHTYTFTYTKESQEPNSFIVTILPNTPYYTSSSEFEKDFNICAAGGTLYPYTFNEQWLMFVSSCGSGYDDGSTVLHGCDKIKNEIEPTLRLQ